MELLSRQRAARLWEDARPLRKWRVWGPGKSTGPTEVMYTLGLKSGFCSSCNDRAKRSAVRKHATPGGASKKPESTHAFEGGEALGKRDSCGWSLTGFQICISSMHLLRIRLEVGSELPRTPPHRPWHRRPHTWLPVGSVC